MALVFVYGTLMTHGANHEVLRRLDAEIIGRAETVQRWTLVDLGPYPALLGSAKAAADTSIIAGELVRVRDAALAILDDFEGCPDLYTRQALDVRCPALAPEIACAFTYVLVGLPPRNARIIRSGRYLERGTLLPDGAKPEQLHPTQEPLEAREKEP